MVRLLRSVQLFIALASLLVLLSIAISFDAEIGRLLGFVRIGVLVLMEVNLLVCTVPRAVNRMVRPSDLIHLGLSIVLFGALVSVMFRQSDRFLLASGESASAGSLAVSVVSSREITDERGTVVGWEIDLSVRTDDDPAGSSSRIVVRPNRTSRYQGYRFHFFHWGVERSLVLVGEDGSKTLMHPGEGLLSPDGRGYLYRSARSDGAASLSVLQPDGQIRGEISLSPGDPFGQFVYDGLSERIVNGFSVVRDPGRFATLVGLIAFSFGMILFLRSVWRRHG